jgi:hypothetical protein
MFCGQLTTIPVHMQPAPHKIEVLADNGQGSGQTSWLCLLQPNIVPETNIGFLNP